MPSLKLLSRESVTDALVELRAHKLRTALTLLGMVFGVGAVIAMLSIGEGAQQEAMRMIESMGLRNLLVQNKEFDPETLRDIRAYSVGLSRSDVRAVRETLPSVVGVSEEKRIKT